MTSISTLYQRPWGPTNSKHYDEPALTEVDFDIDVYRAVYLPEKRTLLFDVAAFEQERQGRVGLARVFGRGEWTLKRAESRIAWGSDKGLTSSEQEEEIKQDGEMLYLLISGTAVLSHVVKWV